MSAFIEETAYAKVNLDLFVTGKRDDGYHLLDSLVVFTEFGDRLKVREADQLSLQISGPHAGAIPTGPENLVLRAAKGLQELAGVAKGAAITLEKNIPAAAGVGGGSADAAATLRALVKLWDIDVDQEVLLAFCLSLGADIPVCLGSEAAIMRGVGEGLTEIETLPPMALLLVNPGVSLSTPQVFKARETGFSNVPARDALANALSFDAALSYLEDQQNDLTAPASSLTSTVQEVLGALENLPECKLSRMSGSGATCFGISASFEAAQQAEMALKQANSNWWIKASPLKMKKSVKKVNFF